MTYAELVATVARERRITKKLAAEVIEHTLAVIRDEVWQSGRLVLPSFGAFSVRRHKERIIRNPATGESMGLPAAERIGFRPSRNWRRR